MKCFMWVGPDQSKKLLNIWKDLDNPDTKQSQILNSPIFSNLEFVVKITPK